MKRWLRQTICENNIPPPLLKFSHLIHVSKTRRNMFVFIKLLTHTPCRLKACVYTVVLSFTHYMRTTHVKKSVWTALCGICYLWFPTLYWKNVEAFFFISIRVSDRKQSFRVCGSRFRSGTRLPVRQSDRSVRTYWSDRTDRVFFTGASDVFSETYCVGKSLCFFFLSLVQSQYKQYVHSRVIIVAHVLHIRRPKRRWTSTWTTPFSRIVNLIPYGTYRNWKSTNLTNDFGGST